MRYVTTKCVFACLCIVYRAALSAMQALRHVYYRAKGAPQLYDILKCFLSKQVFVSIPFHAMDLSGGELLIQCTCAVTLCKCVSVFRTDVKLFALDYGASFVHRSLHIF